MIFFCSFIIKDSNVAFRHNNFFEGEAEKNKTSKKKLPHLNENNKTRNKNQSNDQKKEFMKTFGNFSHHEKPNEIRDIKSQAGSDFLPLKKTIEVFYN